MRCGKYREGVDLNESRMKMACFHGGQKNPAYRMGRPRRLYFHKACRCGKDAGRLLLIARNPPENGTAAGASWQAMKAMTNGQTGKLWHLNSSPSLPSIPTSSRS